MIQRYAIRTFKLTVLAGASALLLAACERPLDMDLRGGFGDGFTTADAATGPLAPRPAPDNRGVISYPNYQVAVARQGDTLTDVANRVGTDVSSLSRYNGIDPTIRLRKDEIIALPTRVAEPSPATGASGGKRYQPFSGKFRCSNVPLTGSPDRHAQQSAKADRGRTCAPQGRTG